MSMKENKAFMRRYFDAMDKDKSPASVDKYIADSDEELKGHIAFFEAAFPGYQIIAEDMIAEGDKVTVHARFEGTHKGDLMGLAPTDKQVSVFFIITYRIADDKIVEHWMSFDRQELMEQLGAVPT